MTGVSAEPRRARRAFGWLLVVVCALQPSLAQAAAKKPKPKPVPVKCPMISDATRDYNGSLPPELALAMYDSALDIVAVNAWADASALHAWIQVAQLPSPEEGPTRNGRLWTVDVLASTGVPIRLSLLRWNDYSEAFSYTQNGPPGTAYTSYAGVTADLVAPRNAIRINVPLAEISRDVEVKPGTRWNLDRAASFREWGNPPVTGPVSVGAGGGGEQVDVADGDRLVVVGKPECVG